MAEKRFVLSLKQGFFNVIELGVSEKIANDWWDNVKIQKNFLFRLLQKGKFLFHLGEKKTKNPNQRNHEVEMLCRKDNAEHESVARKCQINAQLYVLG